LFHYYSGSDPWSNTADTIWTSDSSGVASGSFDVDFGYNAEDTDGRVVVVHDSVGNKIACGVLSNALLSTVGDYPEMDSSAGSSPSGFVVVEQDTPDQCSQKESRLKLHYMLSGLETSSSGGLHVRLFSEENFFLNVYITHTHRYTKEPRATLMPMCWDITTILLWIHGQRLGLQTHREMDSDLS
tara:strand:- start:43 stop:597 length:555 start_codon:yes stop_codon:yes gene_type:complete